MSISTASLNAPASFAVHESRERGVSSARPQTLRFTVDGDERLERRLQGICSEVAAGVRIIVPAALLEGVLLAGGYGRGEGGVLVTGDAHQPYNDMEFYVFLRGSTLMNDRRYKAALHELGESLSLGAGLEVEFKILSLDRLRRAPVSMFSYDFVMGHRWLIGDDALLAGCDHHRDASLIPMHEATRLLFNRCSGLLYALERLRRVEFSGADADFVGRNLAKARLAIGDAILAACGAYHWSCTQRHERLKVHYTRVTTGHVAAGLFRDPVLVQEHETGVAFKLHPERSRHTREALAAQHKELSILAWEAWRTLESHRLGHTFATPRDYAFSDVSKCPEHPACRNLLVNARTFGPQSAFRAGATRYPRERLLHALTLLLWDQIQHSAVLAQAQKELYTQAADFPGLVRAYERLWHRFN